MIFRPALCRLIVAGRKTQTRRPVKPGERHCRYRPGRTYGIQPGRGRAARGRVEILGVKREVLTAITFDEARAEGFRTRQEFFDYWAELYGDVDPDQEVWAIAFRLVDDPPRLLHRDSTHGYTSDPRMAVANEPEAISEAEQARRTADAHDKDARRKRAAWVEERDNIKASLDRLQAAGLDTSDVRAMKLRLRSLDRKLAA